RQAVELVERVAGGAKETLADYLNAWGLSAYDAGNYPEAGAPLRRALAIWEAALGPKHPHVATSLNNLAGLYDAQGQYAQAEPLYQRALAIREESARLEHRY